MLRHSCRLLCCSRPALGRPLSLATASSSTSSSSSRASTSSHHATLNTRLPSESILIDPALVTDPAYRASRPDPLPQLPRLKELQHQALHHQRQPLMNAKPLVPPKPQLTVDSSYVEELRLEREGKRKLKSRAVDEVPLQPVTTVLNADRLEPELEDEQVDVLAQIRDGRSCFFTGAAGTGKSVLLRAIVRSLEKDKKTVAVTATTGIAARNLGDKARTVHSWASCVALPLSFFELDSATILFLAHPLTARFPALCQARLRHRSYRASAAHRQRWRLDGDRRNVHERTHTLADDRGAHH